MPTDAEMRAQFERVMERMVAAGWLQNFTYTEGKGFHLGWKAEGAQRAILLRQIHGAFRLYENNGAGIILFYKFAQGQSLGADSSPALEGFWRRQAAKEVTEFCLECCKELSLSEEEDFLVLIHIILEWAPDGGTPAKFI